ncbi:hypothetical protein JZ751_013620 [Albula glossodonta]|uniref:Uncharacterized protein n=1 Tax=Albula glossodonta TaxID=121402 RepID=A0A8T2NTG2_9TELE|nr:hypothetical protein JZ751_013620 [Albula glossodonta]
MQHGPGVQAGLDPAPPGLSGSGISLYAAPRLKDPSAQNPLKTQWEPLTYPTHHEPHTDYKAGQKFEGNSGRGNRACAEVRFSAEVCPLVVIVGQECLLGSECESEKPAS